MATIYGMTVTFGGSSGSSGGTVPQVTVKAPTGSTVTAKKGDIVLTAPEKSGVWVFDLPEFGAWVITATKGTQTATQSVVFEGAKSVNLSFFSATIAVTYPAGSTCTCSNGATVLTAPDTSGSCTFIVTGTGTWTVYCTDGTDEAATDVEIANDGQAAKASLAYGALPGFTYTGDYALKTAADYGLSGDYDVLELQTSGTLKFDAEFDADVFMVGGGGSGSGDGYQTNYSGGGGAGGFTETNTTTISTDEIAVTIGAGGATADRNGGGNNGGSTVFGDLSVTGGGGGRYNSALNGGNGGSGGGHGGNHTSKTAPGGNGASDGENAYNNSSVCGSGQGTTTRAFGDENGKLYAGGGGGGARGASYVGIGGEGGGANGVSSGSGLAAAENTGGGGGGSYQQKGGAGGSGVVLVRRAQAA